MDALGINDLSQLGFGVNAETGEPMLVGASRSELTQLASDSWRVEQSSQPARPNAPLRKALVDMNDLDAAHWGIIFAEDENQVVKDAMQRLMEHRNCPDQYTFTYQPKQDCESWIKQQHGEPGVVEPDIIPFYLCIIGGPDQIPFEFQYGLSNLGYGMGRICFDTAAEYSQYIDNIIAYETPQNKPANRKQVTVMGAANPNNLPTAWSSRYLVPIVANAAQKAGFATAMYLTPEYGQGRSDVVGPMSKTNVTDFFSCSNDQLPALLFTASHGWGFSQPNPAQPATQGALVCQDWPSYGSDSSYIFAASDVPDNADLRGMVMFAFACFGAGTPQSSYYARLWGKQDVDRKVAQPIAAADFVAALPKKLMGRPNGILGFFGHIEQTWVHSFVDVDNTPAPATLDMANSPYPPITASFAGTLDAILKLGWPLGCALSDFVKREHRYADKLNQLFVEDKSGQPLDDGQLSAVWISRNDVRSLIYLGDPAVRLRVKELR